MAIPRSIVLEVRMSPPTSSISACSMRMPSRLVMSAKPAITGQMSTGRKRRPGQNSQQCNHAQGVIDVLVNVVRRNGLVDHIGDQKDSDAEHQGDGQVVAASIMELVRRSIGLILPQLRDRRDDEDDAHQRGSNDIGQVFRRGQREQADDLHHERSGVPRIGHSHRSWPLTAWVSVGPLGS